MPTKKWSYFLNPAGTRADIPARTERLVVQGTKARWPQDFPVIAFAGRPFPSDPSEASSFGWASTPFPGLLCSRVPK
jgi:hypothetical protein